MTDLFAQAGPLREAYGRVDWATTALGAPETWSPALRAALDLALQTRFPVTLLWGPDLVLVYNAAYVELIADKHPDALGRPARAVFPEAWDTIGPMLHGVLDDGAAVWMEDLRLPLRRRGFLEECYWTFSYSPVGARGAVEGVIDIAVETTRQVHDRRRLALLRRLGEQTADAADAGEVRRRALAVLRTVAADLPAVDVRLPGLAADPDEGRLPAVAPAAWPTGDLLVEETPRGPVAWLRLGRPGSGPPDTVGAPSSTGEAALVIALSPELAPDEAYLGFLRLVAAALTSALGRVRVREAERRAIAGERALSEALQRSLLTQPAQPDRLGIAVRYLPAAEQARVGGDWYDAFLVRDGVLTLAVGDVAGHDRHAAAAMAQVRNVLRGVAFTLQEPPATVLTALDEAMQGLDVDAFATAVLARVEPGPGGPGDAPLLLRWSNAGHPPPVLLGPDGEARLLDTPPDLLLGLAPETARADHVVPLPAGASVVLYTDGLVERRGEELSEGIDALLAALGGRQAESAEQLADHVLAACTGAGDDDVAVLVLRVPGPGPTGGV